MMPQIVTRTRQRLQSAVPPGTSGRVQAFDMHLQDEPGQAATVIEVGGFWSWQGRNDNTRLISWSRPFPVKGILDYMLEQRQGCDSRRQAWRWNAITELHGGMTRLLGGSDLRTIENYLLCWSETGNGAGMLASAEHYFGTAVETAPLPALFGDYVDRGRYLEPLGGHGPYLALFSVYELSGVWGPTTIHQVLRMPFPMAIAVDIESLGGRSKRTLELAYNTLSGQLKSQLKMGASDPHAQAALEDVIRAQTALQHNQTLHQARIVLLIQAPTPALLEAQASRLQADLATIMKIRREPGQGRELLQYFTPVHRRKIGAPVEPLPLLSAGCGLLTAQIGYAAQNEVRGLILGFDNRANSPVLYDLWRLAEFVTAHAAFLGAAGSGKTFIMETLLYRAATVLDTQVIVLDIMGNFVGLPLALGEGAFYSQLGLDSSLNMLDIVFTGSLAEQIQHATDQLGLLLGAHDASQAGREEIARRFFTDDEKDALDLVLTALYAPIWQDARAPRPLLENLCDRLEDLDETAWPGAAALGRKLRKRFVDSSLAATFNRPSSLPTTQLTQQVYIFDLSEITSAFRTVFYMQLMTIIQQWIADRGRTKPLLIALDEFKVAAQDPLMAQRAINLTKTGRNNEVGVWTADQNVGSYFLTKQAEQILANVGMVFIGKQKAKDVDDVMATWQRLTDAHKRRMMRQRTGQWIAITGTDDYHFLDFRATARELAYFGGRRVERRRRLLETIRQAATEQHQRRRSA